MISKSELKFLSIPSFWETLYSVQLVIQQRKVAFSLVDLPYSDRVSISSMGASVAPEDGRGDCTVQRGETHHL